jgi:hypothetical protein
MWFKAKKFIKEYYLGKTMNPSINAVHTQRGAVRSRTTSIQNIGIPVPMQYLPREEQ